MVRCGNDYGIDVVSRDDVAPVVVSDTVLILVPRVDHLSRRFTARIHHVANRQHLGIFEFEESIPEIPTHPMDAQPYAAQRDPFTWGYDITQSDR